MNLQDAVELFLGEYRESTRRSYAQILDDLRGYIGNQRPLDEIESAELLRYIQNIRSRDAVQSLATVNKYIKTTKVFFNWCVRYNLLTASPAKPLSQRSRKKEIKRVKAMPDQLLSQLLHYTETRPRINALVLFLADTGCRRGGAKGLRWKDVNLETRSAIVTEKGDKTRPVFYGDDCAEALELWQYQQNAMYGEFVFSRNGDPITADSLSQVFRRACIKAGIGSWGPHALRHRKGFQGADARIAPSVMATLLGHSNIETTLEHYYPRDYERAQNAANELAIKPKTEDKITRLDASNVRTPSNTRQKTSR